MNPYILLLVGGLGLVGCLILLLLGISMLREERTTQENAPASEPSAASPPAAVEPLAVLPPSADPLPLYAAPAPRPGPAASAAPPGNPFAGILAGILARLSRRGVGAAKGSAHEVLRVLRDNLTGRILIELGGQRYTNLGDVRDLELWQALQTIFDDLDALRGGLTAEPPSQPSPSDPLELTPSARPAGPAANAPANMPTRLPGSPPARSAGGEPRPLPRPTMNPFKQMAVLREMSKNPPPPEMTIAEQIDVVLQAHIQGTPLMERGLHMRPGPRGDAVFELDGESYIAVDNLPDEAVRTVVRGAIAEWEGKQ